MIETGGLFVAHEPIESVDAGLLWVRVRSGAVTVNGEVDLSSAPAVNAALEPFIERGGQVRIFAREVTFIDAAGLLVMDDAAAALVSRGWLVLLDPSLIMLRAIELIALRDDIEIVAPRRRPYSPHEERRDAPSPSRRSLGSVPEGKCGGRG